jgi:hypothetical protein
MNPDGAVEAFGLPPRFLWLGPFFLSATREKDSEGGIPMEGSTREKFLHTLMQYQGKHGREKASAIQESFWRERERIVAESAAEIDWFPSWKKNQILESLLEKTYRDLILEMEREGLS